MHHFYCESCSGVDTIPHECRTEGCPMKGMALTEHDADDMKAHEAAHQKWLEEHPPHPDANQHDNSNQPSKV